MRAQRASEKPGTSTQVVPGRTGGAASRVRRNQIRPVCRTSRSTLLRTAGETPAIALSPRQESWVSGPGIPEAAPVELNEMLGPCQLRRREVQDFGSQVDEHFPHQSRFMGSCRCEERHA
jgi:hypothetical protein